MTWFSRPVLASGLLGLGLGLGLGWLAGRAQRVEKGTPLSDAGRAKSSLDVVNLDPPPSRHAPEGVICGPDPATKHLSQRLDLCERLLSTQTRAKPRIELISADRSEAELPQAWSSAVAMAMEHCGSVAGPDVTDCAQFPCLALARASEDKAASLACMKTELTGSGLDEIVTYDLEVDCGGDITDPVQVVFAFDSNSDAYQALGEGDGMDSFVRTFFYIGGRINQALTMWPCDGAR